MQYHDQLLQHCCDTPRQYNSSSYCSCGWADDCQVLLFTNLGMAAPLRLNGCTTCRKFTFMEQSAVTAAGATNK